MSLLTNNEKVTKTLGCLKYFKYKFEDENPQELDTDLFLIPSIDRREDITILKNYFTKEGYSSTILESYGTFVLHKLDQRRPLKWPFESFYKFHNLCIAVKLLTYKKCNQFVEISYDDSVNPTVFYEPIIPSSNFYFDHRNISYLKPNDLEKLGNLYKAIEYNTKPDSHLDKDYTRLNNALRFYDIAHDTDWELMKLVLFFVALESLFSDKDDHSDISYKVRLRASHLLYPKNENKSEREKIFEDIKHGYDIRSKILHGGNVAKLVIEKQKHHKIGEHGDLSEYLLILNKIISMIFINILEDEKNLHFFSKKQESGTERTFFNDLVL